MSAVIGQLPLVMVQTNVLNPKLIPVTPDVAEVGVVTIPVPAITVHAPEPITGVFPASVAVVEQIV